MKIEINFAFCALVVLTGSSQTKGQSSPTTTTITLTTAVDLSSEAAASASSSVLPAELDHGSDDPTYQTSGYQDGTTAGPIAVTTDGHVIGQSQTDTADRNGTATTTGMSTAAHADDNTVKTTASVSMSLPDSPASASMPPDVETPTDLKSISTPDGGATPTGTDLQRATSAPSSSVPPPPQDVTTPEPPTHGSTEAPTPPPTTWAGCNTVGANQPQAWPLTYPPASQPRQEVPSELNVGDEDFKGPRQHRSSPLDPLLAGLVSVFIVTTAIVSVVLFLKFRQRTEHPEFHRLQDLPMDDLLEDTPLSRYSY